MNVPTGRPLTIKEAHDALESFGMETGRVPLLLLMHAAVPQSFRADLLNLLKINFLATEASRTHTTSSVIALTTEEVLRQS